MIEPKSKYVDQNDIVWPTTVATKVTILVIPGHAYNMHLSSCFKFCFFPLRSMRIGEKLQKIGPNDAQIIPIRP